VNEKRADFASGHHRLWQARENRLDFQKRWKVYADTIPCWVGLVRNESDPFEYTLAAKLSSPPPAALSMLFSSWLHHLRACLDNSIYALAAHSSGKNPPPAASELYYPICHSKASFQDRDLSASKITEQAARTIERRQPYRQQGGLRMSHLYWLNELARLDRHRFPHLCVGRISMSRIQQLQAGTPFVVEESFRPAEILTKETPLQVIRTERALSRLDVSFAGKHPIVYPEVLEWAKTGKASTANGRAIYVDSYPRLLDRMERVELEVLAAFADLVRQAGLSPQSTINVLVRPGTDPYLLESLGLIKGKGKPQLRGLPTPPRASNRAPRPRGKQGHGRAA
jgi:hypothetical protein